MCTEDLCSEKQRLSVEAFALVFLPAAVKHQSHHGQHGQAQDGEQQGEEQLQPTHPLLLHVHWEAQH